MEIVNDPRVFQRKALAWRAQGVRSALAPTMGALHAGHWRLIEEAHARADKVSVSLFVNPIQFGPSEDLDRYPRTFEADAEGCRARGVDILFAPTREAMYPDGFQTRVTVERMAQPLCGASRPGHFDGVTTVVMKLLMLAQPGVALFGWKDAQQFLVIRRMVEDMALPVELVGVETVRDADGLALSSRNAYLSPEERADAPLLYKGLGAVREAAAAGQSETATLLRQLRAVIERSPRFRIEYAEARSLDRLELLDAVQPGNTLVAVAARLGTTRLIDNIRL